MLLTIFRIKIIIINKILEKKVYVNVLQNFCPLTAIPQQYNESIKKDLFGALLAGFLVASRNYP